MNRKFAFLMSLLLLCTAIPMSAVSPEICDRVDKNAMNQWVDSVYGTLTLRQRVAQLIVPKIEPEESHGKVNRDIENLVIKENVGGFILEEGNAEQITHIINRAQAMSKVPLMFTVDAEWGISMRLREGESFPRNMALGAIQDDDLLYEYGKEVARQCKMLGVYVNFAPVVDVNTNPENPVIATRAFGEDIYNVAKKSIKYAKGLEAGGVLSVAKHFPGHGSTSEDSHKTLPVIDKSMQEIKSVDMVPFVEYINARLGGVLTAHLEIPALRNNGVAVSLDAKAINGMLKNELGFEGLVFTDALDMKGASKSRNVALQALKAGNDVLLQPKNVKKEIDAIVKAVEKGEIAESLVEDACKKVLRYKYILGITSPGFVSSQGLADAVNSSEAKALNNRLCVASITVIKNQNGLLPLKSLEGIAVGSVADDVDEFVKKCRLYADVEVEKTPKTDASVIVMPITKNNDAQISALKRYAETGKPVVAVFLMNPYKVKDFAEILENDNVSAVIGYQNTPLTQSNTAQAIFGGIGVDAKLPVTIPAVAKVGTGCTYKSSRLGYATPEEVGVSSRLAYVVDSIANYGVETGAFPGCQVIMARHGKIIHNGNYGYTDPDEKVKVDEFTLYDLASVSKATGTLPGVMLAFDRGLINLESPASLYIPELRGTDKEDIKVKELLFHESGIQPAVNLYSIMFDHSSYDGELFSKTRSKQYPIYVEKNTYGNIDAKLRTDIIKTEPDAKFNIEICKGLYGCKETYDTLMHRIYTSKLRPTKKLAYSCLNFCLLMRIEENMSGIRHNRFVQDNIYKPIGAYHTMYRPLDKFEPWQIAPTEQDNMLRRQKLHGFTHDELACFSGGIQGNAALFSNATDLAKLCQMWLNGGTYGGVRVLSEATVEKFTTTKSPTCRRGLGFDKPDADPEKSPTCEEADLSVYGHLGYTGTVFWVDPKNDMIFVFLCNRVNPTRSNAAFNAMNVRPDLFKAMYDNLIK